ncbi:MAG: hypothetical protein KDD42_01345 [Bdellovibrionales bacterium]|nr:hypothetical protein [Bdellovibrionales bacterium]
MEYKLMRLNTLIKLCGAVALAANLVGCNAASRVLNPFYETPGPIAQLGDPNDHALSGDGGGGADAARAALTQMRSYQRAHAPQPVNPVINPAVVRLMWVPDHLNRHGDLVPAHYYYLKVLSDRWAVSDAFELEAQLDPKGSNSTSNLPYVLDNEVKR